MSVVVSAARQIGGAMTRAAAVRRVALRSAAGRSLVLLYHRVGAESATALVPTVSAGRLRDHLDVLRASGHIVPLRELLDHPDGRGPRFAVTFDDDYPSHVTEALPALSDAGAPATFFLCGRALHGLGAPWWERLEALLTERDATDVARAVGLPLDGSTATPDVLAAACEAAPDAQRKIVELAPEGPPPLAADDLRALTAAGLDVGYHTLHHHLLPALEDGRLADAVTAGRDELARHVGRPLELFAYPHGKADRRVAAAVRRAGYRAAWTGWPAPHRPGLDRFLLPRWEPGRLDGDAFAAAVAIRLLRTAPAHRRALRG